MPHARRIAIATLDEARATQLGSLVVAGGLCDAWTWFPSPVALAEAVVATTATPRAVVVDHLVRSEVIAAAKSIRAILKVPIVVAYNGDTPEEPGHDPHRLVAAWIPRPVLQRELVAVLRDVGLRVRMP